MSALKAEVNSVLDPLQIAYREARSTNDAFYSIIHLAVKHLKDPKAYAWILFVDFSSAFNTPQPQLLISKLMQMNESSSISTGAPSGCVSSPVLFTLYTNDCTNSHPWNFAFKILF